MFATPVIVRILKYFNNITSSCLFVFFLFAISKSVTEKKNKRCLNKLRGELCDSLHGLLFPMKLSWRHLSNFV